MGTFSAVINVWRLQRASEYPVPIGTSILLAHHSVSLSSPESGM